MVYSLDLFYHSLTARKYFAHEYNVGKIQLVKSYFINKQIQSTFRPNISRILYSLERGIPTKQLCVDILLRIRQYRNEYLELYLASRRQYWDSISEKVLVQCQRWIYF